MDISEIRAKYPQYDDLPDAALLKGLHSKFYADMPYEEFSAKISGVSHPAPIATAPKQPDSLSWLKPELPLTSGIGKAISNIPESAANVASGIAQSVMHPIDTVSNLWDAAAGGLRNITPMPIANAIDRAAPAPEANARIENTANQVGKFFKDRYGGIDAIKNTLTTDPVGSAMDASALLAGGGGLARMIPKGAGVADTLSNASRLTNPLNAVVPIVRPAIDATGRGIANLVGNLGTHTGGEGLKTAFRAGRQGGAAKQSFTENMRGQVPMTDVLDTVKANLETMAADKSAQYRSGMAQVSGDKSVLNFGGIDKAVNDASKIGSFKGQTTNTRASKAAQEIADIVNGWKKLDPAEFHTPEGIDALKKSVGGVLESIPFEEKTARLAVGKVYNAVKDEITKQAPAYSDVMKGYSEASDQIKEIERALSAGKKASVDTAMRKLQSLTRNNANTNYGNRLDLAKQLETQGGREILPALAGQSLNSWTPRGLGNAVAGGLGLGGYAVGGPGLAAPILAAQSPRLMGETALKLGQGRGLLDMAPPMNQNILQLLYQSGRVPQ